MTSLRGSRNGEESVDPGSDRRREKVEESGARGQRKGDPWDAVTCLQLWGCRREKKDKNVFLRFKVQMPRGIMRPFTAKRGEEEKEQVRNGREEVLVSLSVGAGTGQTLGFKSQFSPFPVVGSQATLLRLRLFTYKTMQILVSSS